MCWRYSSGLPRAKIPIEKTAPLDSLIFRVSVLSFVCSSSVRGMYGIGGRLLTGLFSHSESFYPLGVLEELLILEER
jgi:hypothetical protein